MTIQELSKKIQKLSKKIQKLSKEIEKGKNKMRRITLACGDSYINTTCEGTSWHIYNRMVVHRLSSKGKKWLNALPDDHGPITVTMSTASERLDYITEDPLP